ncbi:ribosomal protein S18-alanine N-acetyltransferase [Konateibacter massiliensis]|uniref:ribosomal protein S18-alanine N-acetyltransferase n=1 Tax=Konateibacter massiliensis TaxID=2002841 RepID=UPI000C1450AA|nr:ribosomal protein S18-alanine N-acetyltransferase [Konateibacter massiliensis]
MIEIRLMREDDIIQVNEIEKAVFSMPWSIEDLRASLAQKGSIYVVACDGSRVVGYCGLWNIVGEGNINNVAVDKEYRGRHIAFDMLLKLIEIGNKEGVEAYTLEVRESNETAIHLYKKLGFTEEGIRKNYYEHPAENAIIMWYRP